MHLFQSLFIIKDSDIPLNNNLDETVLEKNSTHIYIDIGCFDGETIEHFIYFTPNSILYDIITFEPDPINYQLCKKKLKQKQFENYSITIIPKVVWLRNEKVPFLINHGENSRIKLTEIDKQNVVKLNGIDFSSWLSRLVKSKNTRLHVKVSMPGSEVPVLRKLLIDETLVLAERWDIQWTDRYNPRIRAVRIYIQSMIDALGYSCIHYTRIPDVREVYQKKGTLEQIAKHSNWQLIPEADTYCYYIQRPTVTDAPRTTRLKLKSKNVRE
ncbi:unnamed protein product [Rotaria magnacalcarata]|uniref:Methyltransferase FkbM domain-containing protein n=1 Tax=Rotaria magnacalcarata TaxID=392030 RepID=A0A814XNR0_9BILA|nr:unnamed protein product [Rotaria magnacalcarata]CAF1655935.1 unnamed protein product [Rotaria magnacalcarata]CAF2226059.1 unnamed protein product [Rotaria magnacalcarata]CAF3749203.1 unnamed protein product [Rotaria magnacalcarata]CAF3778685.1 unnamed protein product [Rotaria magnacalcarata]